jgi:hypothetical protein
MCSHTNTVITREPSSSYHYAAESCADCGAHLRYLPRPSNINRRASNAKKLEQLQAVHSLSEFECGIVSVLDLGLSPDGGLKLSPRQQVEFEKLCAKHGVK